MQKSIVKDGEGWYWKFIDAFHRAQIREADMEDDKKVLTVGEVAAELRLSRNATYSAIAAGEIPSVRVGGRILVPRKALDRLLNCTGDAA